MRVLQFNTSVNYGSTGDIAENIGKVLLENNHESYIAFGRINNNSSSELIKIGNRKDIFIHGIESYLFDRQGLSSRNSTINLLKKIDDINPDIIGIHNLHGYYINYKLLFQYLKIKKLPVVWTLHDCWPFTGHCSYFDSVNCTKWQSHCNKCPLTRNYPKALVDRSYKNFVDKKNSFLGIDNMVFISPSNWLSGLFKRSFLNDYKIKVIRNGIDINTFKPLNSIYNVEEKIVLGVASIWDKRKGLEDFIALRKKLPNSYKIVLIGLSTNQIENLPKGILGLTRTRNVAELVDWYNKALVFVNPTYADNFPTTNIEALACGTQVITYNTGGSPEAIVDKCGIVVDKYDICALVESIRQINKTEVTIHKCRRIAIENFDSRDTYREYLKLYELINIDSKN